ncbi:MAG TPA: hypothetical protein VFO31_22520 [Vicinamibacterales bacterium]|nr:hypothetical protein [Vicinamibacterales bacterium]
MGSKAKANRSASISVQMMHGGADPGSRTRPGHARPVLLGTVSTLLAKLSKRGEVVKAERGYRLPGASA